MYSGTQPSGCYIEVAFLKRCTCACKRPVTCVRAYGHGESDRWWRLLLRMVLVCQRDYHVYQTVWTPAVGETLRLAVEPTNSHDIYAVALIQDAWDETVRVVGHVPRNVSCVISFFLKKDDCVDYCEVTGERTNHGAGLGLEIPCVHRIYGRQPYVDRLKSLLP